MGDIAAETGDRNVSAWLAGQLRIDGAAARAQTRLATDLESTWTGVGAALAEGSISVAQASVIVKALNELRKDPIVTSEHLVKAQATLLEDAAELSASGLRQAGRRILEVIDPELFEAAEARRLAAEEEAARRRVSLTARNNGDGTMEFHLKVPLAVGARFKTYLEAYAQPRKQSLAARGERRRWDLLLGQAFIRLVEQMNPENLPHHGGEATTVMITMSLDQLRSELGTAGIGFEGEKITAGEARRMACNAQIVPVVLGADSEVLDVGRASRLATPVQRRALRVRYQTCCAEGCDIPAPWTDVHHLDPWSQGGSTNLDDLVLLCNHHHHVIHSAAYDHECLAGGRIKFHRRT